jgi:hypothetical protein
MSRIVCFVSLLAAGIACWPGNAAAQLGKGGSGLDLASSAPVLLNAPTVQKDLELTPEQMAKGKELAAEFQAEMLRSVLSLVGNPFELAGLPPVEREAKLRDVKAKGELLGRSLSEKYKPKAAAILSPEQAKRLQQIGWQAAGASALTDPQIAGELALSEEQKSKLGAILKEFAQKQSAAAAGAALGAADPKVVFAKIWEGMQERDAAVAKLLTAEQAEKYQVLRGKPIDVKAVAEEMMQLAAPIQGPKPFKK